MFGKIFKSKESTEANSEKTTLENLSDFVPSDEQITILTISQDEAKKYGATNTSDDELVEFLGGDILDKDSDNG